MLKATHTKIVLALKHESVQKLNELDLQNVLLLDNQSTFDLCCNKNFTSKILKATNTLHMKSNGGGEVVSRSPRNVRYQATSTSYGSLKRPSQTSFASRIQSNATKSPMIVKWTHRLWSTTVQMAYQISCLRCTHVAYMCATQRRWVSLDSSIQLKKI